MGWWWWRWWYWVSWWNCPECRMLGRNRRLGWKLILGLVLLADCLGGELGWLWVELGLLGKKLGLTGGKLCLLGEKLCLLGKDVKEVKRLEEGLLGYILLVGWNRISLGRRIESLWWRELLTVMRGRWMRIHTLSPSSMPEFR